MKSVLVTGASGGVGQAVVRRLDELGWRVFAGVRSSTALDELTRGRPGVVPVELDVCDESSISRATDQIAGALAGKGLDGLVNNAGLSVDGPLELVAPEALRHQFDVNVIGQVAVTQAVLPMLRAARGRVVNIGGAAGRLTLPMYGALSASKAALESITEALRMELKHQGVSVSYIEPGALRTDFFKKSSAARHRDGYFGAAEVQRIYSSAIDASAKALGGSRTSPVEVAAGTIAKALTARRPVARYVVGFEARVGLRILPRFPVRLRDQLLMSSLGLGRDAFTAPSLSAKEPLSTERTR